MVLIEQLAQRILVADGATGTQLQKAGLPPGYPPELWNVEKPVAILDHHRNYLDAGADIILTNTFGGNPLKLDKHGLSDRTEELNLAASQLARRAAGSTQFVFGDVGPTGMLLEPLGQLTPEDAVECFSRQISALAKGGVDAILIETMSAIEEAEAAVTAARKVTDLPIAVTFSFDTRGRTMMGLRPKDAAERMDQFGVQIIGANCGRTLSETLAAVIEMRSAQTKAMLMAKPNAGLPSLNGDQTVYDVTPEVMADYAVRFAAENVRIFGGCCGSNPDHIRAATRALKTHPYSVLS